MLLYFPLTHVLRAPEDDQGGAGGDVPPEQPYLDEEPSDSHLYPEGWGDLREPEGQEGDEGEPGREAGREGDNSGDQGPQFTGDHYRWGAQLGLSPQQVEQFGDPAAFEQVVAGVGQFLQQHSQPPDRGDESQQGPQSPQPEEIEDFQIEDPDDVEPVVRQMAEHQNKRFRQLESKVDRLLQESEAYLEQQRQSVQQAAWQEFDTAVQSVDEELFGQGSLDEISQQNRELAENRLKVAEVVARWQDGYLQRGENPPSAAELAEQAAYAVFGQRLASRQLQRASQKSRQRGRQSAAPPTSREEGALAPEERAIRAAAEWQHEHGWDQEPVSAGQ